MRLIDVDAFLKEFITEGLDLPTCQYSEFEIFCMLQRFPAVDAVSVVRCKDCKRCKLDDLGNLICGLTIYEMEISKNDYCSYGERKDKDALAKENNEGC